jgi:hypothetical protein
VFEGHGLCDCGLHEIRGVTRSEGSYRRCSRLVLIGMRAVLLPRLNICRSCVRRCLLPRRPAAPSYFRNARQVSEVSERSRARVWGGSQQLRPSYARTKAEMNTRRYIRDCVPLYIVVVLFLALATLTMGILAASKSGHGVRGCVRWWHRPVVADLLAARDTMCPPVSAARRGGLARRQRQEKTAVYISSQYYRCTMIASSPSSLEFRLVHTRRTRRCGAWQGWLVAGGG